MLHEIVHAALFTLIFNEQILSQRFLLAIFTKLSITGTSVSTPTVVARAAGLVTPNRAMATATASSKKLEAPIIPAGAAMLWGRWSRVLDP